jgi:glucose-6-phosphate dehydrogenase assembly protein OpcA
VDDTQRSILLDAPKEVDITAIEKELTQLWKQAAEDTASGDAPVVRACSLNLMIFTEGVDRASGLEEIVSQITVDHPSRIFLISANRDAARPNMEAWVSARCSLPAPGGKQVCCEGINLVVSGTDADKVPSIVTSLLVPDIPTVLIWKARLDSKDSVLQLLIQLADRVLIDSSEEMHPAESLIGWNGFIEEQRGKIAFGDLAWTHLMQWRTLLARAFQPAEARVHLTMLDTVTIEYSSTRVPLHSGLSQSFLAAAWLGHVLRWVLVRPFNEEGGGVSVAMFRKDEQSVTVRLKQIRSRDAHPGGVESITLHASCGGEISWRSMERGDCVLVRSSLSGVDSGEIILSIHYQTEAELVSRELEVLYNDPLFESSMSVLAAVLS